MRVMMCTVCRSTSLAVSLQGRWPCQLDAPLLPFVFPFVLTDITSVDMFDAWRAAAQFSGASCTGPLQKEQPQNMKAASTRSITLLGPFQHMSASWFSPQLL
ncbi:hypothetical protein B0T12DRAFT_253775 [Alternaria alternata]|nr:hypothetical protein B0T12DRAFT_253775 [Alternaria alternata]